MSSFVWCEWICSQCGYLHRMRFDITVSLQAAYQLKGMVFEKEGVYIEDVAFSLTEKPTKKGRKKTGSKIYVRWNMEIEKIIKAVRTYMPQFYAVKENTLKVEICRA